MAPRLLRPQLKHPLGGKTGTTNDFTDAWFIGFSPSVTCGTWIGFDDRETLGEKEDRRARAALPMWMDFMRVAIANKPNEAFATAGAPKKTLDVPLSSPADKEHPLKPQAPKPTEDVDPDAPGNDEAAPKPAAAPSAAPMSTDVPADDKPKAPVVSPAGVPAKGSSAPAKPTEDQRKGLSNPPPDTN